MKLSIGPALVLGIALLAGACKSQGPGYEIDSARGLDTTGDAFSQSLYSYYIGRAEVEQSENDYMNADMFASKARMAASGTLVLPEFVSEHNIPDAKEPELVEARQCLIRSLDAGGRTSVPDTAALAQLKFDCWMEEQEENIQPRDIAACRAEFYEALNTFKACDETPEPMAMPVVTPSPAKPEAVTYIVYFDFDSTEIDHGATLILEALRDDVSSNNPASVAVFGHADRSGDATYNDNLSRKRAEAVRQHLLANGVESRVISSTEYGETRPQSETEDGVRHPLNRRVEIILTP